MINSISPEVLWFRMRYQRETDPKRVSAGATPSLACGCFQSVAAFAVSAVASQWERTGKPFNPLLGETYELIR